MKKRTILYIIITTICIICVILAVYYQLFDKDVIRENQVNVTIDPADVDEPTDNPRDVLAEFNKLFTNEFYNQDYPIDNIEKYDGLEDEDIVYTAYDIKEEVDQKYNIDVVLPVVNIAKAASLNNITQTKFADKATSVLNDSTKYTVYSVEYTAYLNENILSVAIKATLKEGNSAQRVIVQTYNYDIENNKQVTLNEVLEKYGYKIKDVNKKIDKQVEEASKQATIIAQATSQIVYQ